VRLPDSPTEAIPKSEEKLVVMSERAESLVALFHPRDAPHPNELFM
jgi:hypothetical protein